MTPDQLRDAATVASHNGQLIAWLRPIASPASTDPLPITMTLQVSLPDYDDQSFGGVVMSPAHAQALLEVIASARPARLLSDEHVIAVDRRAWHDLLSRFRITPEVG